MTLLVVITWLGVFIVVLCLFYYVYNDRHTRRLQEHRRIEISELAMVFQTLRDVVSEQKILAKEFNEQIEEKLSLVRGVVNEAQNKMKQIQQEICEQSQKLKELQEQIDRIVCQKNVLSDTSIRDVKSIGTISIIEAESVCEEINEKIEDNKDKLQEIPSEEIKEINEKEDNETLISLSKEQEDIQNAYHSLVGLSGKQNQIEEEKSQISVRNNMDRKDELTPIQKMVLEYHNAGMTTSEIAKELGKTKGEVRLILSLAISKSSKE